jgi:hypothetical protein
MSLMQQQFAVTHRYTLLQEKDKPSPIFSRLTLQRGTFLRKYKEKQLFCGHNVLKKGAFVKEISKAAWNLSLTSCVGYDKLLCHERFL